MNISNPAELLQCMERLTKTGLISLVIRDASDPTAVEGELLIDFKTDPKGPVLKVMKNGKPQYLFTESDRLFREFQERVFQVGSTEDGDGYKPSIYFKLKQDSTSSNGFTKENITAFYNELKNSDAIKPFIQRVKIGEQDNVLSAFSDTDHTYIDISEIFGGAQDVKTVTECLTAFWTSLNDIKGKLEASMTKLKGDMDLVKKDFDDVDAKQNELLELFGKTNDSNLEAIKNLQGQLNALLADVEKAIRPIDVSVLHNQEDVVVPVLITLKGGRVVTGDVKELFNSALYIVDARVSNYAKIGGETLIEGGTFNNGLEWSLKRDGDDVRIFDCKQLSNNSFVVMLRTGNYRFFNKHIEDVIIEVKTEAFAGYSIVPPTTVVNKFVNGEGNTGPIFRKFCDAITVTSSLIVGSGMMNVEVIE